jgi:hypothetical protein
LGDWEIFGFSNFHRSNLLGKRLAIGRILGNKEIFGELEMDIGHWRIRPSEMVGASFSE